MNLQGTGGEFLKINDLFNDDALFNKAGSGNLVSAFSTYNKSTLESTLAKPRTRTTLKRYQSLPKLGNNIRDGSLGRDYNILRPDDKIDCMSAHQRKHSTERKISNLASSFNIGW